MLSVFAQDKVCDMSDVIESDFAGGYSLAKQGIDDFSNSFKVHVNYQGLSEIVSQTYSPLSLKRAKTLELLA